MSHQGWIILGLALLILGVGAFGYQSHRENRKAFTEMRAQEAQMRKQEAQLHQVDLKLHQVDVMLRHADLRDCGRGNLTRAYLRLRLRFESNLAKKLLPIVSCENDKILPDKEQRLFIQRVGE